MYSRSMCMFLTLAVSVVLVSITGSLIPDARGIELDNLELLFESTLEESPAVYSYGSSISGAGDVNKDGYDDIIVAFASYDSAMGKWLSKASIFLGGNPMDNTPDITLSGDYDGEAWVEVSYAGDVNDDGFADVVMSNHGLRGVRVFFGGDPMDTLYDVLLMNDITYSFANTLSYAGDVDGDGYDDIIVGDYTTDILNGSAAIFFGGPDMDSIPDVVLRGHRGEGFGTQVAGGGDLNCDGYDDVVVGELDNSQLFPGAGKVYIFFGGSPMDTIPDVWLYGEGPGQHLGWCPLDILNVDGMCDWVVIGNPLYPNGFASDSPGKIYILYGDTLMDGVPDAAIIGEKDSSGLGQSTHSAGRAAAVPFDALVSGAPVDNGYKGSAYLWLSSIPFDTIPDGIASGSFPYQSPGWHVACAGDVNGDGYDEIVFSNSATIDTMKSIWICRYTGTGISENRDSRHIDEASALLQNVSNPFAGSTLIRFRISRADLSSSSLDIYDAGGRHIRNLWRGDGVSNGSRNGMVSLIWDGKDERSTRVPGGVYFCTLSAGAQSETKKAILLR